MKNATHCGNCYKAKRIIQIEVPEGMLRDEMLQLILTGIQKAKKSHNEDNCGATLTIDLFDGEIENVKRMREFTKCRDLKIAGGKKTAHRCIFDF